MRSLDQTCTPEKCLAFCAVLAQGYSVQKAAEAIGISRRTAFNWKAARPDFAAEWDAAYEAGSDLVEDEIHRRSVLGWDEPIFYKGEECGLIRKYSDTLLIFQAKARRPDKFRESNVIYNIDCTRLNDEQLRRLAEGEHPHAVLADSGQGGIGTSSANEHIN